LPSKGAGQADLPSPASEQQRLPALAFGIERLGLVSLRFPLAVRSSQSCSPSPQHIQAQRRRFAERAVRSDTAEFRQYEDVTTRFPSTEFDVLLVIEGEDLLARESIEKLRGLAENLQLIGRTRGLISLFSARRPPGRRETPAHLFPDELPEGAAYQKLVDRVMKNEILRGKLLSEDGQLTLMVLALEPSAAKSNETPASTAPSFRVLVTEMTTND
jgi:uncharacterized protein